MGYHFYLLENCESDRITAQRDERREAGRQRERELERWILEDQEAGRYDYATTLQRWRDSVVTRLIYPLPGVIKLPQCIRTVLQLARQEVWMKEDRSVHIIVRQDSNKNVTLGLELIACATQK